MGKRSLWKENFLVADLLFFIGAAIIAAAPNPALLIVGRIFIGLGVGMVSMTSPLYISEASPANVRGALVGTNGFLIIGGGQGGQFLSYLINLAFTKAPGTWRWMLGIAGVPALLRFILMLLLPESPRWLYKKRREEEAESILRKIYPAHEADGEIRALKESVEAEVGSSEKINLKKLLAGFTSNQTALALSLVTSGLNAITVFYQATTHSLSISRWETAHFAPYTCPKYQSASTPWDCMMCLKASSSGCGFYASGTNKLFSEACLISNSTMKDMCHKENRLWYEKGCPSKYGWLALAEEDYT
ncbi:putative inositol transporter 2 [Cocos nucifera]|uniref:Putative inositol transporter 2 n=1 Tax=Cocos nucifera TaxID=13894 RepID=A0A8K0N427_COCNU|nr:putative inositol transporter 2 [Cocos nucifera]